MQDDTDDLQKLIDGAQGGSLFIAAGHYMIDAGKGLHVRSDTTILMHLDAILEVIPNDQPKYKLFSIQDAKNVIIRGGQLVGDRDRHKGKTGEWGMGIAIGHGAKNITIDGVSASKMWGDGFYVGTSETPPENVTIKNCLADHNRRQGLSITSVVGMKVLDSVFSNTKGTRPEDGIDIEPDHDSQGVHDLLIEGNIFKNNGQVGIEIAAKYGKVVRDVTIRSNSFKGQKPLKIGGASSNYKQSWLSAIFCLFGNYSLEQTECRIP